MKRSKINHLIHDAEQFFDQYRFMLPPWAYWEPNRWKSQTGDISGVVENALGWDLTDFGLGDFESRGLLLFTVRNGHPNKPQDKSYAEKIMIVRENQVTPFHFHWQKTEDIINRGGGSLVIELVLADRETEQPTDVEFDVQIDGVRRRCRPHEKVQLLPGESITLYPYLYHSFWAQGEKTLVGEVSSVNDDTKDNRFLEPLGRFPTIEEDQPPVRLLVSDYGEWIS